MWIAAACGALLGGGFGFAQSPAAPKFEVAAIKPSDPGANIAIHRSGYHLTTTGTSLLFLITWAYDVHSDRVYNKPGWLDSVRYDVIANAPEGASPARSGQPSALQQMMQALLAERFKLALHRETRQLPIYALVVAKGGPKLRLAPAPESMGLNPFKMPSRGSLIGTQVSAEMLANVLSNQIGRTVRDATGLSGVFDFKLEWDPEPAAEDAARGLASTGVTAAPSLFTAIQAQLGLKLEGRRDGVEVLVIDHIERTPSEN